MYFCLCPCPCLYFVPSLCLFFFVWPRSASESAFFFTYASVYASTSTSSSVYLIVIICCSIIFVNISLKKITMITFWTFHLSPPSGEHPVESNLQDFSLSAGSWNDVQMKHAHIHQLEYPYNNCTKDKTNHIFDCMMFRDCGRERLC